MILSLQVKSSEMGTEEEKKTWSEDICLKKMQYLHPEKKNNNNNKNRNLGKNQRSPLPEN